MFRISTIDTLSRRRLVVEGVVSGPCITALRSAWKNAARDLDGRKLRIDLRCVTVISREGEDAILDLMRQGAKFSSGGICTKYMVKRLTRHAKACCDRTGIERIGTEIALRR
jgi:hypothetical protein